MSNHYAGMHKILIGIKAKMQDRVNWQVSGLCAIFHDEAIIHYHNFTHVQLLDALLQHLMDDWPKSTRNAFYPVPNPEEGLTPGQAYHAEFPCRDEDLAHMWDKSTSPYAALRWELLDFLIETTKPE